MATITDNRNLFEKMIANYPCPEILEKGHNPNIKTKASVM